MSTRATQDILASLVDTIPGAMADDASKHNATVLTVVLVDDMLAIYAAVNGAQIMGGEGFQHTVVALCNLVVESTMFNPPIIERHSHHSD